MKRLSCLTWLAALMACIGNVAAQPAVQPYPSRPIHIVVPAAPGGTSDFIGRLIGKSLSEQLGQTVVIENRSGAGNTIGAAAVAKAAPDGYTLLLVDTTLAISPSLYAALPYDTAKDLAHVALIATAPYVLVAGPRTGLKSVGSLVSAAKAQPGKFNYASGGIGTGPHLAGFMFGTMAGLDIVHVPYKGAGPALQDVVAGQADLIFAALPTALAQIRAGRAAGLAVTSATRSPAAPDLPTLAESGFAGYDVVSWFGLSVPAATPREVVVRLNRAVNQALQQADVQERLRAQGASPARGSAEEFSDFFRGEMTRWARVVRDSGAKAE